MKWLVAVDETAQSRAVIRVSEACERLLLNLPDSLPSDALLLCHIVKGQRGIGMNAKTLLKDPAVSLGQVFKFCFDSSNELSFLHHLNG